MERPWGQVEVLSKQEGHCVRRLIVNPDARLSLPRHRGRREHWFIVDGIVDVDVGGEMACLCTGQSVDFASSSSHRLINVGRAPLVVIEVATGASFDDDDIECFADDGARAGPAAFLASCA
jgi:mannose-6-phosphate isomerase-like protein (cupin superfamily)